MRWAWMPLAWASLAAGQEPAEVVAKVNGVPVTRAEFDAAFRQTRVSDLSDKIPPAELAKIKSRTLQSVINRELLNQKLAELKVPVNEEQVEDYVRQVQEKLKARGMTLEQFLARLGVSEEKMRADMRQDFRWVNYVNSQAKESVLRKYFEANKPAFEGATAKCRHLLVACADDATADQRKLARNRAEDLRARIAAGEAFDTLAKKHSDCPSRAEGGQLPEFPRKAMMSEPFAAAAFGLKPGELSGVVESEFGYHLIVLQELKAGVRKATFEEVQDEVKTYYGEDLRRSTVASLRSKARIELVGKP